MEDRPPREAELIARAKGGELDAYEEILRRHQAIAFRTAWVITRSAADAEEAAQDGFVKAHTALSRFREDSPFRPWLLAIVSNEARNRLRAARPTARGDRAPSAASPRGDHLPLPARPERGGDCRGARLRARHGQVTPLSRTQSAAAGARRGGGMRELEQRLTQLARELDWPETPELAPAIRRCLTAPLPQRRRPPLLRRSSLAPPVGPTPSS